MKIIVNVNENLGIGSEGDLLINIPEDMKFFRKTTAGSVVIMGRKTLESFPGCRPLKGRINIVLTSDPGKIGKGSKDGADRYYEMKTAGGEITFADSDGFCDNGEAEAFLRKTFKGNLKKASEGMKASEMTTVLLAVRTREEAISAADIITGGVSDNVYVIGGASVYKLFLDDCDTCLITVNDSKAAADKYFPDIMSSGEWKLADEGELKEYEGVHYRFNTYSRR